MNLNRVAIQCSNDSSHQMFRQTDGARCVECESIMVPIPVSEADYRLLPSYINWWREQRAVKTESHRDKFYAIVGYVKELETLLLHNGIPLPSSKEDEELPRPEGSA